MVSQEQNGRSFLLILFVDLQAAAGIDTYRAVLQTMSYFPMKNYGLTKAGYRYVGKLLKFSQPASKEIRDMMAENRKIMQRSFGMIRN
jgi:hypothetical protein